MTRRYYLEAYLSDRRQAQRFVIRALPAVVGRDVHCDLQLNMERISRQHALFDTTEDGLTLTDLGSTNGTFINHQPIQPPEPVPVGVGDIIHFANHEFRLMRGADSQPTEAAGNATQVGISQLPNRFPLHTREFFDLLHGRQVRGYQQAIRCADGAPFGFELLGRGTHPTLGESPAVLFELAETLGAEVALSRILREVCFAQANAAGLRRPLFFNTHPEECRDYDRLLRELHELSGRYRDLQLVFEVHESAVTDLAAMAEVRRALRRMGIALAYDDFGAGQARLQELVEVPPDYLKFDIALVRDLDSPDSARYQMLASLTGMIARLGVKTLAEGVETPRTAELCRAMGIDYLQGYYYGRPEPIAPAAKVPG